MQIYWDPFQRKINQWHERVVTCYSFGWTGKQEIWILKPNANNLILPSELIIAALQIIPNLVAKTNKIITISSYCGSGIWEWFSWVVLAQGLKWDYNKSVSQDSSHLKSSLSLENPIPKQAPSHGCRLEVSVSHHGTLTRTVHNMVTNFARARDLREREAEATKSCILYSWKWHTICNAILTPASLSLVKFHKFRAQSPTRLPSTPDTRSPALLINWLQICRFLFSSQVQ